MNNIPASHKLIYKHPHAQDSDITIFLLSELHPDEKSFECIRAANGAFISSTATPGSVVVVESVESLENALPSKKNDLKISTDNVTRVVGWDKTSSRTFLIRDISFEIEAHIFGLLSGGVPIDSFLRIFDKKLTDISRDEKIFDAFGKEIVESVCRDFSSALRPFIEKTLTPLEAKNKKLNHELFTNYSELWRKSQEFCLQAVAETFPARTQSMVDTLQKVHSLVANGGLIFFIAGRQHLVEDPNETDPRFSLAPLKAFLQTHKEIAIVEPIEIKRFSFSPNR